MAANAPAAGPAACLGGRAPDARPSLAGDGTGDLTGDMTSDLTGDTTSDLTGDTTMDMTDDIAGHTTQVSVDDESLLRAFAESSAAQFAADAAAGDASCACGDLQALHRLGHDLKGVLRLVGESHLATLAACVEQHAAAGDLPSTRASWQRFRACWPRPPATKTAVAGLPSPGPLSVLFVEDYAPSAKLLRDTLRLHAPQIRLDLVGTVAQARERLARFEFAMRGQRDAAGPQATEAPAYDAVLTDLNLPDGLGLEILAHVRGRGLPLPVLLLSGCDDAQMARRAHLEGACAVLVKDGDYLMRLPALLHAAASRRLRLRDATC